MSQRFATLSCVLFSLFFVLSPTTLHAWGGFGHRTVAAIAAELIPAKAAQINAVLALLEIDSNFIDAASYPDEFIRNHDPARSFSPWHFSDLRDDGQPFVCGECLYKALPQNLSVLKAGENTKDQAVALAWVIHLVGDLHQPLHMIERSRGGNDFKVTYRGRKTCKNFHGSSTKVELHSAWDDCLVEELAAGRDPKALAKAILGNITTYQGRPEVASNSAEPWKEWGDESHALALSVAFDNLNDGDNLDDSYIKGQDKALDVVQRRLLAAGIRLAFLLDQYYK